MNSSRFVTKLSHRFGKPSTFGANKPMPFKMDFKKRTQGKAPMNVTKAFSNNRASQSLRTNFTRGYSKRLPEGTEQSIESFPDDVKEEALAQWHAEQQKLQGLDYENETVQRLTNKYNKVDSWGHATSNIKPVNENSDPRLFSYFTTFGVRTVFATGIRLAVLKYLYHLSATASQSSVAVVEVDLEPIPRGKTITISWRSKPVFIRHRSEKEQNALLVEGDNIESLLLRDPQTDTQRFSNPEWTIVIAICTHLGCVPLIDAGAFDAFFCPCHGSHYDSSGRVRKGPAPLNLEVPEYKIEGNLLTLGS
mmetsp:Transcript_900/g.1417  ORF Transcript_900/g.1417 Transcript_900/m.1417 type:complete len:307 (+) Transcript_900:40-960(+)